MDLKSPEQARFLNQGRYAPRASNLAPLRRVRRCGGAVPGETHTLEPEGRRILLEILLLTKTHLRHDCRQAIDPPSLRRHRRERQLAHDFMFSRDGRLDWLCELLDINADAMMQMARGWEAEGRL